MEPRASEIRFAAIDFESAGTTRGETDVPVQVGIAEMLDAHIDDTSLFTSYLASDRPIHWKARRVHGIRDEDLVDAPSLGALWPEFRGRLGGRVVVAHGAATEKRFLRAFPLHGFGPWVDTLTLARRIYPSLPDYSLGTLSSALGLDPEVAALCPGRRWHDALFDAVASLVVLRRILSDTALESAPVGALLELG